MPLYYFLCGSCGYRTAQMRPMHECGLPAQCASTHCLETLTRLFTAPQVIGQPDRLREENKHWWLKDGQTYSATDKLAMDREDARRFEAEQSRFAANRKQYGITH